MDEYTQFYPVDLFPLYRLNGRCHRLFLASSNSKSNLGYNEASNSNPTKNDGASIESMTRKQGFGERETRY